MSKTTHFTHGDREWEVAIRNGGNLVCPMDRCRRSFDTEHKLRLHISEMHGILKRKTIECDYCGDEFTVGTDNWTNDYCSVSCAGRSRGDTED